MKKIIVSSLSIRKKLKDADIDIEENDKEFSVKCADKYLVIDKILGTYVETNRSFDAKVTARSLKRLNSICGIIEEQPIVIEFGDFSELVITSPLILQ